MDTPLIFQDELDRLTAMFPEGEINSNKEKGYWVFNPPRVSAFTVCAYDDPRELALDVYLSGMTDKALQDILRLHEELSFSTVCASFDMVQASDMFDCDTCGIYSDELSFDLDFADKRVGASLLDTHFGGGKSANKVYTDDPVQAFRECCETVFASVDDKWKDLLRPVIEENVKTVEKLVSTGLLEKWAAIERAKGDEIEKSEAPDETVH